MITIFAEKPDVGTKIAAALDGITLESGKKVSFAELGKYESQIKALRAKNGYFKIRYLGEETFVTWGYGHMCELKQAYDYNPDYKKWTNLPLPYIPDAYELKLMESAKGQYRILRECFQKSNLLICATDNDREGDLIFDYIYRYMDCRVPFKRAIFNKQAEDEYQKAFARKMLIEGTDRLPVIEAGRARSEGDFIVGAGPTVALSLKNPNNGVLSVGRVQTATLNMIVEREQKILSFQPKDYFIVKGLFTTADGDSYIGVHRTKRVDTEAEANTILERLCATDRLGTVSELKVKQFRKGKPHLYSLDTLQMDASKAYGFSLERTLELAQSLYEKGYTTYPRTDAVHLTDDMPVEMAQVLENLFSNPRYAALRTDTPVNGADRQYFDSSKVESHYAIVPTTKPAGSLSGDEQRLYHLIALVTICMVYPEAVMSRTEIVTDVHGDFFDTSGTSIVSPGFFQVLGAPKENLLPSVQEKDILTSKFAVDAKKTEPPKRYTAATLLAAMLNCGKTIEDEELKKLMADGPGGKPRGLGRPSSRASIVSKLEDRKYILTKGKTIYPTKRGMDMIAAFPVEDLKSAVMTAKWELRLDNIERGTDTYGTFMRDLEESVRKWTTQILQSEARIAGEEKDAYACPLCGKPLFHSASGYGCSGYRETGCPFFIGTVAKKKLTALQIQSLLEGKMVHVKGLTSKKGTKFEADCFLSDKGEQRGKVQFIFNDKKIRR